jgi:hypothetical protein
MTSKKEIEMTKMTATPPFLSEVRQARGAPGDGRGARERADYVAALLDAERQGQNDDAIPSMNDQSAPAATPDFTSDVSSDLGTGRSDETDETDEADDQGPDERPSEPEIPPDSETFTVRVNGEEIPVTRDELLRGYSRTQDYKQKTARLAEERRSVQAERQALSTEKQQIEQTRAQAYALALEHATEDALTVARGAKADWAALSRQDPVKAQSDWFEYQAARDRVGQAILQARQQAAADQEAAVRQAVARHQQHLAGQARAAADAMPELLDAERAPAFIADLKGYLGEAGFSPAELDGISDHRLMVVARDAMLYRRMLAKQRSVAAKKLAEAPRVMSPKRSDAKSVEADDLRRLRKRAQETGKLRDNADYVLAKLRSQ